MLTEKSRLKAVMKHQKVDRPPVICPGGMMSAATTAVLQTTSENFHSDPLAMAKMAEAIGHRTGFENMGVPFCMTVEAELFGSQVDMGDSSVEPYVTEYGVKEIGGIMSRPLPDPKKDGRSPVILSAIKYLSARNKDIPIIGNITGPMSLATSIIDPLYFFRLLRKKPEEVALVLNYLTDYLVEFSREQVDAGADVIAPTCGISLATPVENLAALMSTVKGMGRPWRDVTEYGRRCEGAFQIVRRRVRFC